MEKQEQENTFTTEEKLDLLRVLVDNSVKGACGLLGPDGMGERQTDGAARFFEETLLQVARKVAVGFLIF